MVPTRATVWLLVIGLLLWLTGYIVLLLPLARAESIVQAIRWVVYGFDAGILVLLGIDALLARRTSASRRLRVRRERPAPVAGRGERHRP